MAAAIAVEGFWDFSVRTYRSEGVPDACLALQNEYGADVNMLLYCAWVGAVLGAFDGELYTAASGFSRDWAESVVIPLRSARTWMKHTGCTTDPMPADGCMQLRDEIKGVEFAAEKLQQQVLESLVTVAGRNGDAAETVLADVVANLHLYSESAGFDVNGDVRGKLGVILQAAFPNYSGDAVTQALQT